MFWIIDGYLFQALITPVIPASFLPRWLFLVAGGWDSGTFTSEWRCLSTAGNPQGLLGSDSDPLKSDRIVGEFASETTKRAFQGPSESCLLIQTSTLNMAIMSLSKISENCSLFSNPFSILLSLITGCSANMEETAQPFSSACGNPQAFPHSHIPLSQHHQKKPVLLSNEKKFPASKWEVSLLWRVSSRWITPWKSPASSWKIGFRCLYKSNFY